MKNIFENSKLQQVMHTPLIWCVILLGFSAPISVALDNVLMAVIFMGVIFSFSSIYRTAITHPVARAAMLLFLALFIAMFYGSAPMKEALAILGKYADLAFVAIYISLLVNDADKRKVRYAFLAAMAITLVLSWLLGLGVISTMSWMNAGAVPADPGIFQGHDTQNNLMTFAILLALLEWRDTTDRVKQIAWAIFALLGTLNILFLVQGRTGYLTLFLILGWFGWSTVAREMKKRGRSVSWKHASLILLAMLSIAVIAYVSSARLHDRVVKAVNEFQDWAPNKGKATPDNSSTGARLDFYTNTLQIVQHNFLIGVGTGGFPAAYEQQAQGKNVVLTRNPHDEYLMITAQTGVIGLALLLYLFYTLWRCAPLLPTPLEEDAAKGLVLAYLVNCLLNSALMDHTDGLFFALMSAILYANLKIGKNA